MRVYLGAAPGVGKTSRCSARAGGGATAAPTSSSDTSRRTVGTSPRHRSTISKSCPAARSSTATRSFEEMDLDGDHRPRPAGGPRRRVGAHERARLGTREAVAGHRHDPRRRHRRDLDRQHPAPRIDERRRRADHRDPSARDGARCVRPPRRSDRARRHDAGSAAPPLGARQRLPVAQGRRRARQLLPAWQPRRAARARPAVGRRPGRGRTAQVHVVARHRPPVGDTRACARRDHRRAGRRSCDPSRVAHGRAIRR